MTRFTRIAIALLLSASSFAVSEPSPAIEISPDTKIVLPHDIQSFLQPVAQDSSRASCLASCQTSHTSCISSAITNDAKSACEKGLNACNNACPLNKN
ncbi:MAG: hypothetical protein JWQ49_3668 [Edaphobacter sp.]|nr:hypothetical protein [Edaphobacter sp.]